MQRVAATQAKVTEKAAQEKKARALAYVWAAIAERKRNREQEVAQTKEALLPAKQRKEDDGTERSTDTHAEMSGTQQDNARATEKVTRPATEAKAERKRKSFQYLCPACQNPECPELVNLGRAKFRLFRSI